MAVPVHFSNVLLNRPELAKEVGYLIADYAALELMLFETYVAVSHSEPEEAFSAFFSMRSINNKTGLVIKAAETLPPVFRKAVDRLSRRMKGAAQRRTEIAHVHFMDVDGREPMRVHLVGQRATVTPLTDEFISRTADQFRTLGIDLIAFASVLTAGNPAWTKAKSGATILSLHEKLRRSQHLPAPQATLSEAELAAADARLGLSDYLARDMTMMRPRESKRNLPHGYRIWSITVRLNWKRSQQA